jgi:hypothetical protein
MEGQALLRMKWFGSRLLFLTVYSSWNRMNEKALAGKGAGHGSQENLTTSSGLAACVTNEIRGYQS